MVRPPRPGGGGSISEGGRKRLAFELEIAGPGIGSLFPPQTGRLRVEWLRAEMSFRKRFFIGVSGERDCPGLRPADPENVPLPSARRALKFSPSASYPLKISAARRLRRTY